MHRNPQARIAAANTFLDPQIWIVTSGNDEERGGLVATFVTKASIVTECPRYLLGIARQHNTWRLIEQTGHCGLHLIGSRHLDWVPHFGGQTGHERRDKLSNFDIHTLASGVPLLQDAIAGFDCRVEARLDSGDRTIYLLQVMDAFSQAEPEEPLRFSTCWPKLRVEHQQQLGELLVRDQLVDRSAIINWRADILEAQS